MVTNELAEVLGSLREALVLETGEGLEDLVLQGVEVPRRGVLPGPLDLLVELGDLRLDLLVLLQQVFVLPEEITNGDPCTYQLELAPPEPEGTVTYPVLPLTSVMLPAGDGTHLVVEVFMARDLDVDLDPLANRQWLL